MRNFYHFIGTGIHRESRWFRNSAEENPFPIEDQNGMAIYSKKPIISFVNKAYKVLAGSGGMLQKALLFGLAKAKL